MWWITIWLYTTFFKTNTIGRFKTIIIQFNPYSILKIYIMFYKIYPLHEQPYIYIAGFTASQFKITRPYMPKIYSANRRIYAAIRRVYTADNANTC